MRRLKPGFVLRMVFGSKSEDGDIDLGSSFVVESGASLGVSVISAMDGSLKQWKKVL